MKILPNKILGSQRDMLVLAGGQGMALVLNIFLNIILGKIYSAEAYGNLGVFMAIALFLGDIVNLKSDMAIMISEDREDSLQILLQSLVIGFFVSLIFFFGLWIVNHYYPVPTLFVFLYCMFTAVLQPFSIWLNKSAHNTAMNIVRWLQVIISGTIPMIIQVWVPTYGLVWGMLVSVIIASIMAFALSDIRKKELVKAFQRLSLRNLSGIKQFLTFGTVSSLCNTFSRSVPYFFIDQYFGKYYVGQFTFANKLLNAPLSVFTTAMSQYYYRTGSRVPDAELYIITKRNIRVSTGIIVVPALLVFIGGEEMISQIFGQQWLIAGSILKYLMWWQFFAFIANPITMYFDIKRILHKEFIANTMILIVRLVLTYYCVLHYDFYTTIGVFCFSGAIMNLFLLIYIYYLSKTYKKDVHV